MRRSMIAILEGKKRVKILNANKLTLPHPHNPRTQRVKEEERDGERAQKHTLEPPKSEIPN